jgi:hypothetical protein
VSESPTAVLERLAPGWAWLRENFKLPAVVAIGGLVLSSGAWIYSQRTDIESLQKRDPTAHLERIEGQLSEVLQTQSAMKEQLTEFGRRIDSQDHKWERVEEAAEIRVPRKRGGFR